MVGKNFVLMNKYKFFIGISEYVIGGYVGKIYDISVGCVFNLYSYYRGDIIWFIFGGVIGCIDSS